MKTLRGLAAIAALLCLAVLLIILVRPEFQTHLPQQARNLLTAARKLGAPPEFDFDATQFGIRWFPTHVHFGPDGDTLLVDLCHVNRRSFCRIGKYSISRNQWDILPFEAGRTYLKAIFSPDGQWIVYTSAPCDDMARCNGRDFQMFRMAADGSKSQLLADTVALYPSFAHNGKKLIYWRWRVSKDPRYPKLLGGIDLYQLDWETRKEAPLTALSITAGLEYGRPFFTPDGEKFVFAASPMIFPNKPDRPKGRFFVGSMANAPIDDKNYMTIEAVDFGINGEMMDIDKEGRVLYRGYQGSASKEVNPVIRAIRPRDPKLPAFSDDPHGDARDKRYPYAKLSEEQSRRGDGARLLLKERIEEYTYRGGNGGAFLLRPAQQSSRDEAGFDLDSACAASLSPDGLRLAFVWVNCGIASERSALGLIGRGQAMKDIQFIDWPRLNLTPSVPKH